MKDKKKGIGEYQLSLCAVVAKKRRRRELKPTPKAFIAQHTLF